jgi:LacI family transcriptional regulator
MKKKAKRTSLKDIAERVGVSTALVSYVLNGQEKEKRVGAEVAHKIREAMKELNYSPNQIARSLRKGSTKTIGLVVTDIANPFFGVMARIIEDEASKHGYVVIMVSSDEDFDKSSILVDALLNRQVDGFIIVPADGPSDYVRNLVNNEIPVVLVDRHFPDVTTSYVSLDNYAACYDATKCFMDKGYKRIGMVVYKSSLVHMEDRKKGYINAMEAKGLKENILVREVTHSRISDDINKCMKELTQGENKVEAILFATNTLSVHGLYYFLSNNIRVPEEMAVIGFDGSEAFDFFYSPLTYIKQPIEEMAKKSVNILLDQIKGATQVDEVSSQHQLIKRKSCG